MYSDKRVHRLALPRYENYKKVRNKHIASSIAETSKQFCRTTHLHGLATFLEIIEMYWKFRNVYRAVCVVLWIISMLTGIVFGSFLMLRIWQRYSESPTITTIETTNYPIGNIAFPAVTICNVNTVYKPHAEKFVTLFNRTGIDEKLVWAFLGNLSSLIDYDEIPGISDYFDLFYELRRMDIEVEKLMYDLLQPCSVLLKRCYWLGKPMECMKLFRRIKTEVGFCCSFNYKAIRPELETNPGDSNVVKNDPVIHISGSGEDASLRVILDVEPDTYVSAKRIFYGAELIIHDPEAYPGKSLLTAYSEPGQDLSIAVIPSIVTTDDSVRGLPLDLRYCSFQSEKRLLLTTKYSFESCISQYRALTIFETCGCIPFFYPNIGKLLNRVHPPCKLLDVPCLNENRYLFASVDDNTVDKVFGIKNTTHRGMNCDCLPSCTEQYYNVEKFLSQRVDNLNRAHNPNDSVNLSSVTVYFKDQSCIKYRREIFMTWDDLLAQFGGIFGLCLGGSVICVFQFVYYATFRLYELLMDFNKDPPTNEKEDAFPPYVNKNVGRVLSYQSRKLSGTGNGIHFFG